MLKNLTWKYCQEKSDLILASGLSLLEEEQKYSFNDISKESYGNYLISDSSEKWNYIGEAKNLLKRIKQHSKISTSTLYKNYLKLKGQFPEYPQNLQIKDFCVRNIQTNIGRKELEEFGIVNLPALLNKFQKGKRSSSNINVDIELWHAVQNKYIEILEEGEMKLEESVYSNWFESTVPSAAGLYLVKNKDIGIIYIGESSDIFERYKTHSERTYFSALRRHIGEKILSFELQKIKGKKRYFSEGENIKVTEFLKSGSIKFLIISFGRFELEEYLIRKYKPFLNRKENN